MKQIRITVSLTLTGPILTRSTAASKIGVDASMARDREERCVLPFSLVKGRIRQSWEELALPEIERLFGDRRGGWNASRGALRFSDFVETGSIAPGRRMHRIRIDSDTGAAKDGALLTVESPFAAGQPATFEGDVSFFARSDDDALAIEGSLQRAFRWSPSFGAERTIGFGRVRSLGFRRHVQEVSFDSNEAGATALYDMEVTLQDPLCLARRRIDENFFESDHVISGAVLRGVLATTLNRLLGRDAAAKIDRRAATGTPWEALAGHLNDIALTHCFPSDGDARPYVRPLTIVHADGRFCDVALEGGPALLDGKAPEFGVDWKKEVESAFAKSELGQPFHAPDIPREVRVRTAIDRSTSRAAEAQLFSHELLDPTGIVWRGTADFSRIDPSERPDVVRQFRAVMAMNPAAFGKTKARGTVVLKAKLAADHELASHADGFFVVALQTPTLLCDPDVLNETSGREDLVRAYADAWHDISGGSLHLEHFFAEQELLGGYLVHRFRHDRPYRPFLLTAAGSVFVLRAPTDDIPDVLKRRTLPLPRWAKLRYGESWEANPFLPDDGFGEIAVNLACHRDPSRERLQRVNTNAFAAPEWTPRAPSDAEQPAPADRAATPKEEVAPPAPARVSNRWRITGRLTTRTDFHLGNGESLPGTDRQLVRKDGDGDIHYAAVATGVDGRSYIPGSSLKGALRSWLTKNGISSDAVLDALFGHRDAAAKDARAGSAEFHDAFVVDAPSFRRESVPHWSPQRLTGVTASVAIDRWTRTASEKKLMHREYVPPGVTFEVVVTGQNLSRDEVAVLLYGLERFNDREQSLALGAETREGWGRFEWQPPTIAMLDCTNQKAVAKHTSAAATLEGFEIRDRSEFSEALRPCRRDIVTIPVRIEFDGAFLVNEPGWTKQSKDPASEVPNHAARRNLQGDVALPVSSLRGALRAQAERIVRTLEPVKGEHPERRGSACHCTDSEDACKAIENVAQKKNLCLVCRLFGAGGWASAVSFSTPKLVRPGVRFRQEFVAIDRFTGGGAESAKFNADAYWRPAFETTIAIDRSRCGNEGAGLLALVLRDLAEGDVVLGFGASKGYGSCTARVTWAEQVDKDVDAFLAAVGASSPPRAVPHETVVSPAASAAPVRSAAEQTSNDLFFNPYHFVPVTDPRARTHDIDVSDFEARRVAHTSFDRYVENTFSGRLLCRLTTVTPLVVGSKQEQQDKRAIRTVDPFIDPVSNIPLIPASSLRGLISSVAEAATNSALRVLEDRFFSVRRGMGESLQAIGMIVDTPKGKCVRPLTLPALEGDIVPQKYRSIFPSPVLKVYVDGYRRKDNAVPPELEVKHGSFLARRDLVSYSPDHCALWYLELGNPPTIDRTTWKVTSARPHRSRPRPGGGRQWLLGMDRETGQAAVPIDEATYGALPPEQKRHQPGILRILGIEGREGEMPMTKKHEIFIPYDPANPPSTLLDAADAIAEFERLAAERTDSNETLPFELKGSLRNANPDASKNVIELRDGDLVCFEPTDDGTAVAHLSISSIWRREVGGTAHQFFPPESLPFHPSRKKISIAEQMFGFVANVPKHSSARAAALASRIRFSAACLERLPDGETNALLPQVALKILSSPKPPSPAFYFRTTRGDAAIRKPELNRSHQPQGRKFYLHNPEGVTGEPWRTADAAEFPGQKCQTTPVRRGAEFFFHVDFDNLTRSELEVLCYAIRPTPEFRHKLGMGKAIGLGSVTIDPAGLFLIDRRGRYSRKAAERAARYDECWCDPHVMKTAPHRYETERTAAADPARTGSMTFSALRESFRHAQTIQTEALEILGNPANVVHPVRTPQVDGAPSFEKDTFQWFVRNEEKGVQPQYLVPLDIAHRLQPLSSGFRERTERDRGPRRDGGGAMRPPREPRPLPPPRSTGRIIRGNVVAADIETWPDAYLTYDAGQALIIGTHPTDRKKRAVLKAAEEHRPLVTLIRSQGSIRRDVKARMSPAGKYEIVGLDQ